MSVGVPFGNYRLQRRLARGGMAEVFLARLIGVEGFERRVAIKRILPHLSESEEFRAMFLDEARLAAQLTHANIVHIYDFGKVDDYYFIAMEYVDGVDIGRLIRRAKERPVPFELAARILADTCAGLHFAHNAVDAVGRKLDVVHRDVTPQNVLVSYDGAVKLVDFGIAKAQFAAGRTRPGVVKGKYAYMSPEQVEGRLLDGRSDVFSAGICLYELITGVPLFRRDDVTASMREIRDGKPIHPEKHRKDVPDELVKIMRRALQTSRDSRYGAASTMQTDLERFLKSADALATARELGDYVRREFPPQAADAPMVEHQARPGGRAEVMATSARPPSAPGTQVQSAAQALLQQSPLGAAGMTSPPMGSSLLTETLLGDDDEVPTTPDGESAVPTMPSDLHLTDEPPTNERPLPPPRSSPSHTAVVPPLSQTPLRTYLAAIVAAVTVAAVTLLALRPWSEPKEPVIVNVPTAAPAVVTEKPAPAPKEIEVTPPPVVVAQAAPGPAPTLDILSRPPGARVTVDGEQLRASTPIHAETFASGMHKVVVDKKGYQARELAVRLGDGEHRTLDVELRPAPRKVVRVVTPRVPQGFLTVKTVPWSKVFEGARLLGTTPLANVPLGEGAHTLTFVNPDLPPLKKTVTVRAGEEARISVELKK